jgi:F0F1-type ATP synthase alpha subunit
VDDVAVEHLRAFETGLYRFVDNSHPSLLQKLMEKKQLDADMRKEFDTVLKQYKERFAAERSSAVAAK